MNVLMMTDIEGCAGVVSFESDSYPTGKYYEAAKKLLTAEEARRRIRAGAKAAVLKHRKKPVKPVVWKGPFVLEKRYFHTDVADQYANAPDVERVDSQTVRIKGDDIRTIIYR